ncbi:hypothetical protein [Ruminococcus sp. FC2018]|uniref:hypothetical protein n=1 Tax=Ruminococcus sp. FC2018 TaxID=1410617 RepID=UPI00048A526B|nr:hypothetical protein [Ruminococcus sp. FC2018]
MLGYGDKEKRLIESGFDNVKSVLLGDDIEQARRVLFCLDRYLDPYHRNRLSYENELCELLENIVITSDEDGLIDDCLQLLGDYAVIPLTILEENIESVKKNMRSQARYVINMQTESFV